MKPMSKRKVVKALRAHSCQKVSESGKHEKWECACTKHSTALPRHRQTTAGVIRGIISDLECLPEGWLQ